MQNTFICKCCNTLKPINPKLKGNQKYCGDQKCQRKRKAAWQKHKMATDINYKQSQQELVQQWRVNKPAHKYQSLYRKDHPSYVANNRAKQLNRNQKHRVKPFDEVIVKMDALTFKQPLICAMTPVEMDATGKIVKMDTLLVQLQLYQRDCEAYFHRSR